ncbi:MAG: hypothetical protein FJ315_03420 [SAR202 cluster bacterium]|nr:hypothetical protein [SAR202 cluster bacterium]
MSHKLPPALWAIIWVIVGTFATVALVAALMGALTNNTWLVWAALIAATKLTGLVMVKLLSKHTSGR